MNKEKSVFLLSLLANLKCEKIDKYDGLKLSKIILEKLKENKMNSLLSTAETIEKGTLLFEGIINQFGNEFTISLDNGISEKISMIKTDYSQVIYEIIQTYKNKIKDSISPQQLAPLFLVSFMQIGSDGKEKCCLPSDYRDGLRFLSKQPKKILNEFNYFIEFYDIEQFNKTLSLEIEDYIYSNNKSLSYDFYYGNIEIDFTCQEVADIYALYDQETIHKIKKLAMLISSLPKTNNETIQYFKGKSKFKKF